ncbi:unnamed protein product [Brassicogethes aeneus]|uniref:G-protein coupled receptors family 2 profile 2 domain-containing protein n=1 Tax=Brassicogethes aeneus TaxID=1431903 RepID=A0A9P0AY13_BRAAE|nr:unnamed protein product [Brassicogethes aeneus]
MRNIIIILVLELLAVWAGEPNLCCPSGQETLVEQKICESGIPMTLQCENGTEGEDYVFLVHIPKVHLGNYTFDDKKDMMSDMGSISKDQYCIQEAYGEEYVVYCTALYVEETYTTVINVITLTTSTFFLILTIVVYFIVPNLLDLQGICIVNALGGLAFSFTFLVIVNLFTLEQGLCEFLAFGIYYAFMYSFFWLNTLTFHIWRTTINPKVFDGVKVNCWKMIYLVYGIGGSLVLLVILLNLNYLEAFKGNDLHPDIGNGTCWFQTVEITFIYFHTPMLIILGINLFLFIWTIVFLWKYVAANSPDFSVQKYRLKMCIKLFFVMGISWLFEFLSVFAKYKQLTVLKHILIITDIINGLMGLIIFLILVVFRKRVIRGLAERSVCNYRLPSTWRRQTDSEIDESPDEYTLT